jgi:beta-glucosidase
MNDPLDDTLVHNQTGLEETIRTKGGAIWGGYLAKWDKIVYAITVGQKYIMENTTLGIPAIFQTEGWVIHCNALTILYLYFRITWLHR